MKLYFFTTVVVVSLNLVLSTSVNAAFIERLGGQAYFDTDLNITWLADTNYALTSGYDADGRMTFLEALGFVEQLEFGGYGNWRLPTATTINCESVSCIDASTGEIFENVSGELAYQYHVNLGGDNDAQLLSAAHNENYDLFIWHDTNFYPFFWTSTPSDYYGEGYQLAVDFMYGNIASGEITNPGVVWAVADGDVFVSSVPIPAALWLLGSGLIGLISWTKLKNKQQSNGVC